MLLDTKRSKYVRGVALLVVGIVGLGLCAVIPIAGFRNGFVGGIFIGLAIVGFCVVAGVPTACNRVRTRD